MLANYDMPFLANSSEALAHPDVLVVRVGPTLDFRNAASFRASCEQLLRPSIRSLVLDLSGTGIIDSTGLGMLFGLHRQLMRTGGRVLCAAPSRSAEVVIDLTRSDKVLGKYPTVEAALQALQQPN